MHADYERYWIIELQSGGGGMMAIKRIKSYMDMFKAVGGTIETHVAGFAGSAAFVILVNGSKDYR